MYKKVLSLLLLFLISCTSIENTSVENTLSSFKSSKNNFISIISQNKKDEIDRFFVKGIRNNIILREIKKYDFNNFLLLIPDKSIEVINSNEIKTSMLINIGIETYYFNVVWKKYQDIWKINSIYEK